MLDRLTAEQLRRFRAAIREALARPDDRGYQYFDGWHGGPFSYCWRGDARFLPWHRAYLYFFELALQDIEPEVTLPWWDWATSADGQPSRPRPSFRQRYSFAVDGDHARAAHLTAIATYSQHSRFER